MGHRRTRNRTWSREEVGLVLAATLQPRNGLPSSVRIVAHRWRRFRRQSSGRRRRWKTTSISAAASSDAVLIAARGAQGPGARSAMTTPALRAHDGSATGRGIEADAPTWQPGHPTDLHPVLFGLRVGQELPVG
jgi:hypothetical protein